MKKLNKKKLLTLGLLTVAVILTVELQKQMKRRAAACEGGLCPIPAELNAARAIGPQNVPDSVFTHTNDNLRLPKLMDFGSGSCIPCKMMDVVLTELAQEYRNRLRIQYVDVGEQKEKAEAYGIKVIPTQIFMDADGNELFRHEGFLSKENVLKKWSELGVEL